MGGDHTHVEDDDLSNVTEKIHMLERSLAGITDLKTKEPLEQELARLRIVKAGLEKK